MELPERGAPMREARGGRPRRASGATGVPGGLRARAGCRECRPPPPSSSSSSSSAVAAAAAANDGDGDDGRRSPSPPRRRTSPHRPLLPRRASSTPPLGGVDLRPRCDREVVGGGGRQTHPPRDAAGGRVLGTGVPSPDDPARAPPASGGEYVYAPPIRPEDGSDFVSPPRDGDDDDYHPFSSSSSSLAY